MVPHTISLKVSTSPFTSSFIRVFRKFPVGCQSGVVLWTIIRDILTDALNPSEVNETSNVLIETYIPSTTFSEKPYLPGFLKQNVKWVFQNLKRIRKILSHTYPTLPCTGVNLAPHPYAGYPSLTNCFKYHWTLAFPCSWIYSNKKISNRNVNVTSNINTNNNHLRHWNFCKPKIYRESSITSILNSILCPTVSNKFLHII